ncbi:MAG: glycosyltransferase family 4 protein [Treponema sp.]|nr:glycosyltransferase family 4 protein [Treponema sp.]
MKIFYVDPQSYNNLADYDKYLLASIPAQKIFFCSENMPYSQIADTTIIKNYDYQGKNRFSKVISYLKSQRRLLKIIKNEKPDIVHFQWFKIPVFDYYILKQIKQVVPKARIIHTAHNVLPHDSGNKYKKIYKKIYSFVDKIIVHAEISRMEISDQFGISEKKIEIIPHGYLPSKIRVKKKIDNNNVITFSFIGFLSDYKGLDILLDAWCSCPEILESNNCRLIIAGAGDLQCLKTIPTGKNIILENYFHSEEELAKIIGETDVAILPYRKISQSGVLLTYLAEHIPVLVSNIGGLIQPFGIANVGWILERLDSKCLSETLKKILTCNDGLAYKKNNLDNWIKIDSFYDWKNIGAKTSALYESLCE